MNCLKEVREARGISQTELSELSGISRQRIILIEGDPEIVMRTDTLEKLASALHVSVNDIYLPKMPTKIDNYDGR